MAKETGGIIGTTSADNLIAGIYPAAVVKVFDLDESAVIERGTVLGRTSEGKYYVLGTSGKAGTASAIVAETTEDEDVIVEAYVSGLFYRNLLKVADEYELTEEDENNLRLAGILLTDGI